MSVWTGKQVAEFVGKEAPIKINPNGVDVRAGEIWRISDEAKVIINGKQREISPEKELVKPDGDFYILDKGVYELRIANKIEIPKKAVAFLLPRSTFNRLGIIKSQTAVGDSGYIGFATQTVFVPIKKLKVHRDECWFQLVYMDCGDSDLSYNGHYQDEKPED